MVESELPGHYFSGRSCRYGDSSQDLGTLIKLGGTVMRGAFKGVMSKLLKQASQRSARHLRVEASTAFKRFVASLEARRPAQNPSFHLERCV